MRDGSPGLVALLVPVLLAAIASCHTEEPVVRAIERPLLDAPSPAVRLRGAPRACALGDDRRVARGCLARGPLKLADPESDAGGGVTEKTFEVPDALLGADVVLDRMHRETRHQAWIHLPPMLVRRIGRKVSVPLPGVPPGEGSHDVRVTASRLPPVAEPMHSEPFSVRPGMVVDGAFGIHPLSATEAAEPVRFTIEAEVPGDGHATSGDHTVLLARRLEPDEGSKRWLDYRIDLDAYAGRTVRLSFRTEPDSGRGGSESTTVPLWTVPVLLAPTSPRYNVLLVSIDTLRADGVGTYGSRLPTTPVLDEFGREGVVFEDALAPFPSTTGSHMSMLTGTYPSVHHVLGPGWGGLSRRIPTLAQSLATAGYHNAAFTEDGMILSGAGFARGFRTYREFKRPHAVSRADTGGHVAEVVDAVLQWIDRKRGDSFFVFAHTYEVHYPYDPPAEFDVFHEAWSGTDTQAHAHLVRERNQYAGEIRYTDREIGRLLAGLDARGLTDSTIVVITSDHGEAFGEHGTASHGQTLFSEAVEVPLLLRAPGLIQPGLRVAEPVSLVDVAPTILDLVGRPIPASAQGRSLRPLLEGRSEEFPPRAVYAELIRPTRMVVAAQTSDRKWILPQGKAEPHVYDRRADPGDRKDLATPEELEAGRVWVDAFIADSDRRRTAERRGPAPEATPMLDDATETKLRALGYID